MQVGGFSVSLLILKKSVFLDMYLCAEQTNRILILRAGDVFRINFYCCRSELVNTVSAIRPEQMKFAVSVGSEPEIVAP